MKVFFKALFITSILSLSAIFALAYHDDTIRVRLRCDSPKIDDPGRILVAAGDSLFWIIDSHDKQVKNFSITGNENPFGSFPSGSQTAIAVLVPATKKSIEWKYKLTCNLNTGDQVSIDPKIAINPNKTVASFVSLLVGFLLFGVSIFLGVGWNRSNKNYKSLKRSSAGTPHTGNS
jgi:hypothetical protein